MIVVADTSPINYLVLIDLVQILPELFGQVVIPQAVLRELESTPAPDIVRRWLSTRPDWLVVRTVQQVDATLVNLDEGEREVISLAQELKADLLILDESQARLETRRNNNTASTVPNAPSWKSTMS